MRKGGIFILIVLMNIFIPTREMFSSGLVDTVKISKPTGAYYTGTYQNLFTELLGKSELQVKAKVDSVFNQLFYGDNNTQRVYYPVEPDMAYIKDILHNDVRTEGMSYGMMIAVQMDKKEEFDRLWKWAKTYMQHKSGARKNYFAWHCNTNGSIIDPNSASDGEEWFVMALFFASARWGNGEGIYNYRAEAQSILDAMLNKVVSSNRKDVVTNMFNKKEKQVVFVPVGNADDFTDPSYHTPHFYELWGRWADKNNQFWCSAATTSRQFFKKTIHPRTGLSPDYAHFNGIPMDPPWGGGHYDFRYDAWRVAMNIAVDYAWFAKDNWEVTECNRLLKFFYSQGIGKYGDLYTLDGKRLSDNHSTGLVAMNAVACLAATLENRKHFVEELWNTPIPEGVGRYYDSLLYMLAMLQVSGNFRIYDPTGSPVQTCSNDNESYISTKKGKGGFTLSASGQSAPLYISSHDYPGVIRAMENLQTDIGRVTNAKPDLSIDKIPASNEIVLIGTLGRSPVIDKLVQDKKLNVEDILGKWETFLIQVVKKPLPDVDRALVITGSDKRGTIYGIYNLSEKIGVSPWYWWADVPVKKRPNLYVLPGRYTQGEPAVKYRGIFINDEAPALSGWVYKKFGGFNHQFYEKVFDLILRLKGNFLWPAMWGKSFFDDDSLNFKLADEYGIVIGTSHHEPMMRAHVEWARYGKGPWDYTKNDSILREFWREGIRRMNGYEGIVTIGMRGNGDLPMSKKANIALLERIIKDQRKILSEVTGKDVTTIPQVWALYKEVQEYYDKGMRVPDDVTLLLCDDNWGNIRKLPKLSDKPRTGGYGIYYHYDYVGGPRNYKWLNTNQISRVWEQMHLAYEYGARQIWVVNVGDIKPMEFPIEFFLDYAWNPDKWPAKRLPEYTRLWAEQQFGAKYSKEIADILTNYTKFNSRRKPELLSPETYSLVNFREAETIVADYNKLAEKAQQIYNLIPAEYKAAFYQLVLYPVLACSNLNELYVTVGMNHLYAKQGRAATNALADKAKKLFGKDAELTHYYNKVMANGKWDHMMDQTHIGYTYWQQPEKNSMPEVKKIKIPPAAEMGVAIEGSENWWPMEKSEAQLPDFDMYHQQSHYIEVFNRGQTPFEYSVQPGKSWIKINGKTNGKMEIGERLWVSIDWDKVPTGKHQTPIIITGPNKSRVVVLAVINNPSSKEVNGFVESNRYVSIEAEHYTRAVNAYPITWQRIPDLGRTLSAMTPFPVTSPAQKPGGNSPHLEYQMYLFNKGEVKVKAYFSPTLNFHSNSQRDKQGLRYGISFDNERPQIINMHTDKTFKDWEKSVRNNITIETSKHILSEPGKHVLKFWMVDPGVVLQKLVVETGEVKSSYLGPPESFYRAVKTDRRDPNK